LNQQTQTKRIKSLTMTKKIAMNDYVLLFRGGANPEDMTPEQMKTTMNNWMTWMAELKKRKQFTLGHPLEDGGKILSGPKGKTVTAFKDDKDAIGGLLLIKAKSLADATKIAKGCPIFNN